MSEKQLQAKILRWLRSQGAYAIKTQPGAGTPTGCPDIIALYEGAWVAIEVKASPSSKFQPLQKETLDKLSEWSPFVYTVDPGLWPDIQRLLLTQFF